MSRRVSMADDNFAIDNATYEQVMAIWKGPEAEYFEDVGYGWSWYATYDGTGTWTIGNEGEGTSEDMDREMFEKIAHLIPAGLYIAMFDEYGSHWRYYFDGTHCTLQEGTVVYPSTPNEEKAEG